MAVTKLIFTKLVLARQISVKNCILNRYSSLQNTSWRPRGGEELQLYSFFTSALDRGGLRLAPAALPQGKWPGVHCTEGRVGPLEPVWTGAENLASTGIQSPDRPAHSDYAIPAHKKKIPYFMKIWSLIYTRSQTDGPMDVICRQGTFIYFATNT